MSVPLLWH